MLFKNVQSEGGFGFGCPICQSLCLAYPHSIWQISGALLAMTGQIFSTQTEPPGQICCLISPVLLPQFLVFPGCRRPGDSNSRNSHQMNEICNYLRKKNLPHRLSAKEFHNLTTMDFTSATVPFHCCCCSGASKTAAVSQIWMDRWRHGIILWIK